MIASREKKSSHHTLENSQLCFLGSVGVCWDFWPVFFGRWGCFVLFFIQEKNYINNKDFKTKQYSKLPKSYITHSLKYMILLSLFLSPNFKQCIFQPQFE